MPVFYISQEIEEGSYDVDIHNFVGRRLHGLMHAMSMHD